MQKTECSLSFAYKFDSRHSVKSDIGNKDSADILTHSHVNFIQQ